MSIMEHNETRPHLSSRDVADAVGISYRRLDYWCRLGAVRPVIDANGSGSQRRFSPDEVRIVRAVDALMRLGCTVDEAAAAAVELRFLPAGAWHGSHIAFGRILNLDALAGGE